MVRAHASGFYALAFLGRGARGKAASPILCPVRAVRLYMQRTSGSRRTQQLLVIYGEHLQGQPCLPRGLPIGLRVGVALAHLTLGIRALMLRAHSTRGMVSSVVMEAGIDWSAVQAVAGRAGDQTSKRFCHRVVTSRSVTEAVLCTARIVCLGRPP